MKKILLKILIIVLALGIFTPNISQAQQPCLGYDRAGLPYPVGCTGIPSSAQPGNNIAQNVANNLNPMQWIINGISDLFAYVLYLILSIVSLLLYIAGSLLDWVLKYTIIDLKRHLDGLDGINTAWKVIKDLMNIAFIFILVYKGIELIIGVGSKESIKKFIAGVIMASLLINFSLFFTKILIDASNIVTVGFYNTITSSTAQINVVGGTGQPTINTLTGISAPFMKHFGVTSFWSTITFQNNTIRTDGNMNKLITPIMGIILFFIISFVFFAVAVMFAVRYIALVILLMLSPIAYMGMALPQMEGYARQWWQALNSQLLFGPIYMIMTWVILILMESPNFVTQANWSDIVNGVQQPVASYEQGPMSLIFNFAVIIGLIIASLIISKKTSTSGSAYIANATSIATTKAGNTLMGGSAWMSRKSFGNIGRMAADNADLQEAAKNGKGFSGAWARTKLYTARTARDATYDVRNASVPTGMIGSAIEGTVGRTKYGEMFGLNDMSAIKSIPLGSTISSAAGVGAGGTKSVVDERKESAERVAKREKDNARELKIAQAKEKVKKGADDASATSTDIEEMEKALAKLSDKEIEAMVDGNKKLLDSQNFANALSIKQLEALNKSELLDSGDKSRLKDSRFKEINTAMATGVITPGSIAEKAIKSLHSSELEMIDSAYLSNPEFVNNLKPSQIEAINKSNAFSSAQKDAMLDIKFETINTAMGAGGIVPNTPAATAVKALSDSELESIEASYLNDPTFVAQLKSSQIEAINKSSNFTRTQKDNVGTLRKAPLLADLAAGNSASAIRRVQGMSPEEVAALGRFPGSTNMIIRDPYLQGAYTPNMLKRMAVKMTTGDIQALRGDLLSVGAGTSQETINWLEDPNGGVVDFS